MKSADMATLRKELEELAPQPPPPDAFSHTLEPLSTDQPRSLFDSISQQLAELDRQEEEFMRATTRKRVELKRLWNSALPIHKLPHELLIKLFVDFRGAIKSYLCSYIDRDGMFCKDWQELMLVCRHWREIFVATPVFWREVDLRRRIDWIQLCLSRSSPAPIEVTARYQIQCPLEVLFPHAHRFRTFFCEIRHDPRLHWGALSYFFSSGMPHLEDLHFATFQQLPTLDDIVDPNLTSQRFPSLQALELAGYTMVAPQDVSLYAQLRKLSLSGCSHSLSFNGFLDALAACARLEQLTLSNTLHRLSGEWAHTGGPVPRRPPVSLPRLREFTSINHGALRTSRFLTHLYLQPSVVLDISAGPHEPLSYLATPDPVRSVKAMLPPDPLATFPILAVATHVEMLASYDKIEIECCHAHLVDPQTGLFSSFTVGEDEQSEHNSLMEALGDLFECFGRAPLTHLRVDVVEPHAAVDVWERVFRTFPLLEELEFGSEIEVATVFLGLHAASTTTLADPQTPVACPNLREVHVAGYGMAETYEAMEDCFQSRAHRGAILDVLDLEYLSNVADLTSDARCIFIENLRQVVNHVLVKDNKSDG